MVLVRLRFLFPFLVLGGVFRNAKLSKGTNKCIRFGPVGFILDFTLGSGVLLDILS